MTAHVTHYDAVPSSGAIKINTNVFCQCQASNTAAKPQPLSMVLNPLRASRGRCGRLAAQTLLSPFLLMSKHFSYL